jgi:thiosulfate dehydrogenase [quinone] large subunit
MTLSDRLSKMQVPLTNAAVSVLLLRLFLAYEWLNSGAGKIESILVDPNAYFGGLSKVFGVVWAKTNPYPFMTNFLTNTAAPNASTFVTLIAITEVLVGLSLLLGLLTRVGALGGIVMNLIFYFAAGHTSPSTAGINLIMVGAQLAMIIAPGGRVFGLDAILRRKFASVPLW